ncbi:hypothetical protein CWI80_00575 [Pseudidiomarina sediminum]|uniref:Sulfurtransferase complex subunit TusB n=1 Tax=Pseudidiomarina sediminum TaxID=431675 RepID=A0A432Z7M8_9GAMM|nr:hypothetical protein [Pseudidiomarina sediminum]MBY6063040.1 hypothetical protein [Pseudidiomarina sediminum]RUO73896.1 hypothetical protein CWI80_00575 [Pseudidiomarina sediminum]
MQDHTIKRALITLRNWPLSHADQALLAATASQQEVVLIVSEHALSAMLANPDTFAELDYPCYVLQTELALHTSASLPAYVMQLSDSSWVELTLASGPVTFLGQS